MPITVHDALSEATALYRRAEDVSDLEQRLYDEGAPFVRVDRRPSGTFVAPHGGRFAGVIWYLGDEGWARITHIHATHAPVEVT